LPQSMVVDVVQTQDGYLGMATYDGRARFDGGRFTTFNSARTPAVSNNRVGALAEARDGTLWAGTHGNGVFRLREGVFEPPAAQDAPPTGVIEAAHAGPKGKIWFAATDQGLFSLEQGVWKHHTTYEELRGKIITSLHEDTRGTLWIGTRASGLYRLRDNKLEAFGTELQVRHVTSLWVDQEGRLWVGTERRGVFVYAQDGWQHYTTEDGLYSDAVRVIYQTHDGTVWIGG